LAGAADLIENWVILWWLDSCKCLIRKGIKLF